MMRMRNWMWLLVCVRLCGALPVAAETVVDVPRVDGITIDGKAEDWDTRGYRVEIMATESGEVRPPADFAPAVRWGWNAEGLLLLVQVRDRDITEYYNTPEIWRKDGMEIFVAGTRGTEDRYQVVMGTGADPQYPRLRWHLIDWRPDMADRPALTLSAAATPIPNGYQVEVLLPWQNIGVSAQEGTEIAAQIDIVDAYDKGTTYAQWFPRGGAAFNPDNMYRVRLSAQPSPPVAVAVCGTYKPGTPATLKMYAAPAYQGKRVIVRAGERVLHDGPFTADADGRLTVAVPLALARTERLAPLSATIDGMPVSVQEQLVCDPPLPPEADGVDCAGVVRDLKRQAQQRWPKISSRLRVRHEGMVQFQLDRLEQLTVTDGRGWQEFTERVTSVRAILAAMARREDLLASKRGRFEWAYINRADGSAQPFTFTLPDNYDGRTPLPLIVYLHGSGFDHRSVAMNWSKQDYLLLYVNGRGSTNYRCLGEAEVRDATAFIRAQFPVEPDRVSIYGISMGGWGVLHLADRFPDDYAAVVSFCGYAFGEPLDSLWNVPLQMHHGQDDATLHIDDARIAADTLRQLGARVDYYEYPQEGHGIYRAGMAKKPFDFLLAARYQPLPRELRHVTDQPITRGTCRWAQIARLDDPQQYGRIHLTCGESTLRGDTANVAVLRVGQLTRLFPAVPTLTLQLDGQTLTTPLRDTLWLVKTRGQWQIAAQAPQPPTYQRGGYELVYDGQPLRVVAPLGWRDHAETKEMVTICSTTGDMRRVMPYGRIPILSAEDARVTRFRGHLILIGGPETNPALAALLPQLPVHFTDDTVEISGVGRFPRATTAISLTYRHPNVPGCRILWLYNQHRAFAPFNSFFVNRTDGAPDIVVYDRSSKEPQLLAAANFGQDWALPTAAMTPVLAKEIKNATDLLRETTCAAMRRLPADYALVQVVDWRTSTTLGEGKLTLDTLRAIMPAGQQTIVRARLTAAQLADMRARMKDDPTMLWVSNGTPAADKASYDVVFLEQLVSFFSWSERYGKPPIFSFPPNTLSRTNIDLRDMLDEVVK